MFRYVILEHDWNGIHYDLMLEHGAMLMTWRLASLFQPGVQSATKISDHRKDYLTFEGLVSSNRGSVRRVAEGDFSVSMFSNQQMILVLQGTYQGVLALCHLDGDLWQLDWNHSRWPDDKSCFLEPLAKK